MYLPGRFAAWVGFVQPWAIILAFALKAYGVT
jgi:hypothetical protein